MSLFAEAFQLLPLLWEELLLSLSDVGRGPSSRALDWKSRTESRWAVSLAHPSLMRPYGE